MQIDVAGLGNALVDALVRIPDDSLLDELGLERGHMHPVDHERWEAAYDRLQALGIETHPGGSCANTIATLALMGSKAVFCGQIGDDALGDLYSSRMADACGLHALHVAAGRNTGKCLSVISAADAERTMLTDLGAAVELPHVGDFAATIRSSRLLHITGYLFLGGAMVEAAWEALDVAKKAGIPISVDAADPFVVATVKDHVWRALRDYADIVFLNADEATALTGLPPSEAVHEVAEHVGTVVVKRGAKGSLIMKDGQLYSVGIHRTEAVDTTGAGDAYAAGFLHGWLRGWDPARCGDLGARVATLTVAQVGAVCRHPEALAEAIRQAEQA